MSDDDNGEALAPLDALLRWVATPEERAAIEEWLDPLLTPLTLQSFANWSSEAKRDDFTREYPEENLLTYRHPKLVQPVYERAAAVLKETCAKLTALLATGGTDVWSLTAKAIPQKPGAKADILSATWFRDFKFGAYLNLPEPYGYCGRRDRKNPREWRFASTLLREFESGPRIKGPYLVRAGGHRHQFGDHYRPESLVICRTRTGGASAVAEPESLEVAPSAVVAERTPAAEPISHNERLARTLALWVLHKRKGYRTGNEAAGRHFDLYESKGTRESRISDLGKDIREQIRLFRAEGNDWIKLEPPPIQENPD